MSLVYNGAMRFKLATKTIMHEQESSFSSSLPSDEIATKDIQGRKYNFKDVEWSASGSGVADNSTGDAQQDVKALLEAHLAKTELAWEMTDDVSGNLSIGGTVVIESFSITSSNQSKVTYDYSIKGIGVYTVGEVA